MLTAQQVEAAADWERAIADGTLVTAEQVEAERESAIAENERQATESDAKRAAGIAAQRAYLALPILHVRGLVHGLDNPHKLYRVAPWYERGPRWWVRALSVARVLLSRAVSGAVLDARIAGCAGCNERIDDWARDGTVRASYCGPCGCPKWLPARLGVKLKRAAWVCPRRRWVGVEYGDEALRERLKSLGYGPDLERATCGACGDKR